MIYCFRIIGCNEPRLSAKSLLESQFVPFITQSLVINEFIANDIYNEDNYDFLHHITWLISIIQAFVFIFIHLFVTVPLLQWKILLCFKKPFWLQLHLCHNKLQFSACLIFIIILFIFFSPLLKFRSLSFVDCS